MTKLAFVFPGQGSQYVGMGKELFENFNIVKETYEEASDNLGIDMKKLCFEGPEDALVQTENTQPAILTSSVAFLRVIESEGINCDMTAGLSLGEYGSLVTSKAITFRDAVKLVKKRGKFMQEAVPLGVGTMAAILGLEREQLLTCLEETKGFGTVEAANFNSPGQIVISGEVKAVEEAIKKASEMGAKKAVLLPVSAPFHSSLLRPAGENLKIELEKINISDPIIPVVSNVYAQKMMTREEIAPALVKQVSSSVLWHDSVKLMLNEGVTTFVEIGPGKALSGFIKRIAKTEGYKVNILNVEDLNTLNSLLNNQT